MTELEHVMQFQRTTPVETEDAAENAETWTALKQVMWTELGKVKDQTQEVPRLYALCEKIQQAQQSHEKQLTTLRRFARQVEQHLEQLHRGATPPRHTRQQQVDESGQGVLQTYVPGASASSSAIPSSSIQMPIPPTVSPPPIPIPRDELSSQKETSLSSTHAQQRSKTHFSTVIGQVRAGAIRMDITNPEEWAEGDIAVIRNQKAKRVRDIGSLIFETPIQHDYEEGVEVRSLLSSEQLEEIDGRLAVVDVSPNSGVRLVRFWVDETPLPDETFGGGRREIESSFTQHVRNRTPAPIDQGGLETPARRIDGASCSRESPDFGGGVDYHDRDELRRERFPDNSRESPPRTRQNYTPPEDQNPKGCSLHSMEPLQDWFCKGADMTSAAEFEAALCQLEDDPPDIREYNVNIRGREMDTLFFGRGQIPSYDR